ncbi:rRNA maturation RNase YbeY [Pleurocapsa sp. PCC 7319]|uniref:rRNA maturation RNase YbeY n=1 Tax=Pleurocapsa sp. PCC 7319 TaxID=118161 RepID=UPI0003489FD6|nr:rRNA maturation RNase YbeY [Pleurocapsa sp. PCC 7319]
MDITAKQLVNAVVYVENLYEGSLIDCSLSSVKSIPWSSWFQMWIQFLDSQTVMTKECEVGLRLTDDRQIQILNHQYRSLDQPTDVLAFAATEVDITIPQDFEEPLYLGDIVISLDTAARQAQAQNHSLVMELAWLASHGLLHLLGWDHPDAHSLKQMLNRQSDLIQLVEIQPSY